MHEAGLPAPRVLIGADDVEHGKPSPEGYLLAAERLEVPPEGCLVIEDAPAGVEAPIDSPWFDFKDNAGFARALERSRRGGFQGRLCVHPDQLAPVNAAYQPSAEELSRAERIVAAFRQAEARGEAAVQVDGQMVDYPVAYRAQALLDSVRGKS